MTLRMSVSKISTTNILAVFASNYGLLSVLYKRHKKWLVVEGGEELKKKKFNAECV